MKRWVIFDLPLAPVYAMLEFAASSVPKGPLLDCSLIKSISCHVAWPFTGVESSATVSGTYVEAHNKHVFNIRLIFCSTPGLHNPDIHGVDDETP